MQALVDGKRPDRETSTGAPVSVPGLDLRERHQRSSAGGGPRA